MYSTKNKKVHYFYNGIFYTRKLNDFVDDILFEKIYGGTGLLKRIKKLAKNKNINFEVYQKCSERRQGAPGAPSEQFHTHTRVLGMLF